MVLEMRWQELTLNVRCAKSNAYVLMIGKELLLVCPRILLFRTLKVDHTCCVN